MQLLFCLLEQPSCVYSFEHLCQALGLTRGNSARNKMTLTEHIRRCRLLLNGSRLPLRIALVPTVGYALCRMARKAKS